jgi:hypothetical protein
VLDLERLERVLRLLADRQDLALKGVLVFAAGPTRDEALADHRHRFDHRLAEPVERGRHVAPADQRLAFLGDEFLEMRAGEVPRRLVLGEEAHGDRIVARLRQRQALAIGPLAEQGVGHLDEDAGAVAEQRIGTHGAAVIEVFENFQRLGNDRMAFGALDVGDEAHAASVVFITRIVEPLGLRKFHR